MEIDSVTSFRARDYIKISILAFALTGLWQGLHSIILPTRLLDFVAESQKNTYLGVLVTTGLILGMVVQLIAGAVSDRSKFRWGRRHPYILAGTICLLAFTPGIGYFGSYTAIFAVYCLMQVASNTVQGPYQAFIPELVPEKKHGLASGMKSLFEILGGATFVVIAGRFMDRYSPVDGVEWLWLSLALPAIVLLIAMVVTVTTVKEPHMRTGSAGDSLLWTLLHTMKDIRSNKGFIWFLLSRLLFFMAFAAIQKFALYYLRDVIGVADPAGATANFTVVAIIGMLLVTYPAGYVSDRWGRRRVIMIAGLVAAAGTAIIAMSDDYNIVLIAAGVIGLAMGGFNSSNWALATDLVAKGEEARYLGIANMATACGSALSGLFGIGIDYFNTFREDIGYLFMLLACITCFIAGSLLVLKIKAYR